MAQRVCAVTVTYGDRFCYAENVIKALMQNQVSSIVIIGNRIAQKSLASFNKLSSKTGKIKVIVNNDNLGSAIGFGMAIKQALALPDNEFIWLLDDDTAPRSDTLKILLDKWQRLRSLYSADRLGLVCFRPDHQVDIARGLPAHRCYLKPGCFFGFHFLNIPYRLWRFTPWGPRTPKQYPELIKVPYAAYGGFFAHRLAYEEIGVPCSKYVLYEDDLEYTLRLTRKGGAIFLCPDARIDSQEVSWGSLMRYPFGIFPWLDAREDFRIYYGARNIAYFERHHYNRKIVRDINRLIYLTALFLLSVFMKKKERFKLIIRAIRQGDDGNLGYNKAFPLP